ncbi:MAG: PD-(D/E)XK nuclease family protein, partial [Oscillospiraceae bacterium]
QNYCYIWSATLSQQLLPFKNNPRGFTGELTESDKNNLDIAEATRASLAEPIIHLKKNFKIGTPEAYAKGVYTYLEESRSIANLKKLTDNLSPVESEAFLNSQNLLWEQLVDILDMFCLLPTGISLTPQMFCELLETAASTMETVTIPKAIDCVDVGSCHRMRSYNPPYVFIMGVCQGEFPTISAENSLLSDNDRKKMIEWGLPASDTEAAQELEKAICYRVLTMAEKEMFLSFPALTQKGESITPSIIFSLAERLAEGDEEESPLSLIETKGSLSEQFAQSLGSKENLATVAALANEVLSQKEISRLESSSFKKPHKIESCENSRKLFGENLKLSPSQVENFYSCRYRYFLRYGLKLYPMQKAELSNLEAGTLLHFILEKMIKLHGKNIGSQSEKDLKAEINAFTLEYLQQRIDDFESMGKRLKSNFLKISDWIFELILIMGKELQQTQFTPMFFELPINAKSGIKPLAISCDDGSTATVEGVIDRVDTVSIDSHEYIRIIDYKSGSKVFSLSDVLSGLNMQMLIYIFSIWENGDDFFLKPMPAGILYQPALGKYQLIERNETGNLEKLKLRHYKMNGLLLNDQKVLNAMEPDGLGIFIPFESERSSDEHTATLEQFRRLEGVVKDKIEKMAESLHSGLIDAVPLEINFKRTCENCDYRSICDITDEDKTNRTQNLKKNDFWKVVTEKNED